MIFLFFLVRNKYIATSVTISSYIIRRKIFENFIRLIFTINYINKVK